MHIAEGVGVGTGGQGGVVIFAVTWDSGMLLNNHFSTKEQFELKELQWLLLYWSHELVIARSKKWKNHNYCLFSSARGIQDDPFSCNLEEKHKNKMEEVITNVHNGGHYLND